MHILRLAFVSFGSGSLAKFAISGFLSYFQRLVKIHLFDINMGLWITRIIEVSSIYLHYYSCVRPLNPYQASSLFRLSRRIILFTV